MYDMKNLGKLKQLEAHVPEVTKAFWLSIKPLGTK